MNDWVYDFPPTSKAEWIKQIERDLKGKPLTSLHQAWSPGMPLDPIHHADDQAIQVILPTHLFAQPPKIIEYIDAIGLTSAALNQQLLNALQYGTQQVTLSVDEAQLIQHAEWLKDIYTDMIQWHVCADQISLSSKNNFAAIAPGRIFQEIPRSPDILFDTLVQPSVDSAIGTRWIYKIEGEGNWLDACADALHLVQADAKVWFELTGKNDHHCQSELHIEAVTDYLQCLIQLRTLHVLWQNMASSHSSGTNEFTLNNYLICQIKPAPGESPEAYLVRASSSAVAAFLAGASGLCIRPFTDATPNYYRRINRNIHHLLHMESQLPRQTDLMAGAYAIDHYTTAWACAIWDKLNSA